MVTPFVGVWIETPNSEEVTVVCLVTPFVGVWIETGGSAEPYRLGESHPSWVCGLKPCAYALIPPQWQSHPSWVCGLKPGLCIDKHFAGMSHPSWVCGLKHVPALHRDALRAVTPFVGVWIETEGYWVMFEDCSVTPFVGVWIETSTLDCSSDDDVSHPSWVCGLKLSRCLYQAGRYLVTPFVGVWIETYPIVNVIRHHIVTPFVGVWIETFCTPEQEYLCGSHPSWVCGLKLL